MSNQYDYDLFVIGAGSGGARAARMAAMQGVRVAIAEQSKAGGTCVNLGCVPKKLYVHAAEYGEGFKQARGFGWEEVSPSLDWPTLRDAKSALIAKSNEIIAGMLTKSGADYISGRARITGPNNVQVGETNYSAEKILLSVGGTPVFPDIPGQEHMLSSDQIFDLDTLPKRILIIGGGYIATEFTGIFHGLGVEVTQIYRRELFLRGFDREVREYVASHMKRKGIDLRFNCDATKVEKTADQTYRVLLNDGSELETDLILAATGRTPNISGLGLTEAGVNTVNGAVVVNDHYQTSTPSIYALGDVTNRIQLTPVALAEAMHLVKHLYQGGAEPLSYEFIPTAVFSQPNIGCVGLTEEQAIENVAQVDIYCSEFRSLKHALSNSGDRILMKLIVDAATDRVVGAHMAGENAGEIIQGIAIALKAGATKAIFDQTIGIHPTSAEEFVTMRSVTRSHTKD